MKKQLVSALFVSGILLACKGPEKYLNSYQLLIDPTFTADEVTDIIHAAEAWQAKVPINFTAIIGECIDPEESQVCVHQSLISNDTFQSGNIIAELDGLTWMMGDRGVVYIYPRTLTSANPQFFLLVTMHELGHVQGLVHHTGCFIMNPIENGCALVPTPDDVSQWHSIPREP